MQNSNRDSLKGFNSDLDKADNTFESWKKYVLGQTGKTESGLPFSYKDATHAQPASLPGARNGWLEFANLNDIGLFNSSSASWWETMGLTRMQRYFAFGVCVIGAVILFMISMLYLPLAVLRPAKFSAPYCLASLLIFGSFGFLQGFVSYGKHLISRERMPFTTLFFGTTIFTLYSATQNLGYILTVVGIVLQLVCLVIYVVSYIPGGQSGISVMSSILGTSIRSQFSS